MRKAQIERNTRETQIFAQLNLDGDGALKIETPFPFLSHMLSGFAKHGFFDLTLTAQGDTHIDDHHTIEDIGIVMGEVIAKGLGSSQGITRFGSAFIPLDDALARVVVDLSGRPYLVYHVKLPRKRIKDFDVALMEHFFRSLVDRSRMNLHIELLYGKDPHHILEAIFKGFGRALQMAVQIHPRQKGVPSTKGML